MHSQNVHTQNTTRTHNVHTETTAMGVRNERLLRVWQVMHHESGETVEGVTIHDEGVLSSIRWLHTHTTSLPVDACTHIYASERTREFTRTKACVHACMHARTHARMYVCMYVCIDR